MIDRGPYRLMRHPSYTGLFLMALGIAVTLGTWFSVIVLVVPSLISIGLRVRVEERALVAAIGEPYRAYVARTKRFVPYLW